jgi:large subunit ribosomal protein L46
VSRVSAIGEGGTLIYIGQSICRSCRNSISRNSYASAAAAAVQTEDQVAQHIPPVAQISPQSSYTVNAGVVLSRPPQITRDLHPFESAFFLYQRRLNERLALPFTRYFYFKKRTPADLEWKRKMKQRLTPARDIGRYKGYGDEAWNDEVLVGAKESDFEWQVGRLLEDAGTDGKEVGEAETKGMKKIERELFDRPMPRRTEADEKNDTKSLNRALQRTLYLLVKNKEGQWQFPQDRLKDEHLHGVCPLILPLLLEHTTNILIGSVSHSHASGHKHEHLAHRARANRTSPTHLAHPFEAPLRHHRARRKDILPQGAHHGWPGELEG